MEALTLIFFGLATGLFILAAFKRSGPTIFLELFVSIFAIGMALTDEELATEEMALGALVILDAYYAMMGVAWIIDRVLGRGK